VRRREWEGARSGMRRLRPVRLRREWLFYAPLSLAVDLAVVFVTR